MYEIFGIELLNKKLQQPIKDVKIESFIFNNEAKEVNTIYLKFDEWISLFYDDGVMFVQTGFSEKQRMIKAADGNTIEYRFLESVNHLIDIGKIINCKLENVSFDVIVGLKLMFENKQEMRLSQQKIADGEFGPTLIKIEQKDCP